MPCPDRSNGSKAADEAFRGPSAAKKVKERGVWLRKALQRDILKWHIRALITEIQR